MKEEAIGALEQVRDELREATARSTPLPSHGRPQSPGTAHETRSRAGGALPPPAHARPRRRRRIPARARSSSRPASTRWPCARLRSGSSLSELRRRYPRARPLRPAQPTRGERRRPPGSLARIEHEVALGVAGAFDLHYRLVPRLRALALGLLATRRRVSLDASRDASRAMLGETTWELVRSDRRPPSDRLARGITPAELSSVVDALERV